MTVTGTFDKNGEFLPYEDGIIFHDDRWSVELLGGEQCWLVNEMGQPVSGADGVEVSRDENRKAMVLVLPRIPGSAGKARFVKFL